MSKIYIGIFLMGIIGLGVWQYTRVVQENGRLQQGNAELTQSLVDSEKVNNDLKLAAERDAAIVAKVERAKAKLTVKALKLKGELEVLKNENEEIRNWANVILPELLALRLLGITDNDDENRLPETTSELIRRHPGTKIEVQNENLYNYANDLKSALKSCNKDKFGIREWVASISE